MRSRLNIVLLLLGLSPPALFLFPSIAVGQGLRGVVLSAQDGSRIEQALVRLIDLESGRELNRLTDSGGGFSAERLPGLANQLEVSAFGYLVHIDTVYTGPEADPIVVEVRLGVDAIPVDPLVVVGSRRPEWESTQPKYLWEFFERQELYSRLATPGRFFDREALDDRVGKIGSFSRLESLWPIQSLQKRNWGPNCRTAVFVDGFELPDDVESTPSNPTTPSSFGESVYSQVPWGIEDLVGVELYYGKGIPAEFVTRAPRRGAKQVCRVVAVWTRRSVIPEDPDRSGPRPVIFLPVVALMAFLLIF